MQKNTTKKKTSPKKVNNNPKKNIKTKKIKKKKKVNTQVLKTVFKIICSIAVVVGIIIFLMISPVFNISEIEVTNNKKISKDTYISLSKIKYGDNIYRINKKEITNNIKENAYVENVSISRQLPNKILIEIEEREATFMIKIADAYMYIDNQGYMLEISKDKLDVPLLIGIETNEDEIKVNNRLCNTDLEKLNKVLEIYQTAKSNEIANLITQIDISDKLNYKLILESEKKNIYLGDATDLVNKFRQIKVILEKTKEEKGDIRADRNLNLQPVYFSPSK